MSIPQTFNMGTFPIDEARPIKVAVIGAGYSGIVAGIRFLQRVRNIDLAIYESNAGIGGTWYSNKYPGLMCDIPSHSYQLTFENKTDWSSFYVSGAEILQALEQIVDKYQLKPYIRLQHRLTSARWDESTGKWHITVAKSTCLDSSINHPQTPIHVDYIHDAVDVLFLGVGSLSRWTWPDIKGLETFSGEVYHSANWNTTEHETNWKDKRVAVIGLGSSAIQIVTALQPKVKHLVNYARGRTWIASTFVQEQLQKLGGTHANNYTFTEKDKESFKNPVVYQKFRTDIECELNKAHPAIINANIEAKLARDEFTKLMLQRLEKKPWIAEHLIPDFGIACRRLTPGPGFLEALCADNVTFVPSLIEKVTPTGIVTVDKNEQDLDIIVCATGFETSFRVDFELIGKGGKTLQEHHTPHPRTYLSVAVDGFPNMFQALGPNGGVGAGNLLLLMERQVDYAVAATLKIQRERIKSMDVKASAVDDFETWIESYFPLTVFGTKCRSWYKAGKEEGRVVAIWPGSPMHAARALEHPRWEDFDYKFLDGAVNRFYWFGDGNTVADAVNGVEDKAWYLRPWNIDYPPVPNEKRPNL